ncbi:MAG TPA: hypothetical protein VJ930_10640 [Acidimicrobiia bacterium]|nr:hypothetical protein [Acidimicrobiia bacterium]
MPRSSPSTSPAEGDSRVVEVVELDREAYDPGLPTLGNRPNRWAILLGIVVLGVLGLSLLPAAEVQPNSLDDTLPDPAVATTLVGSRQPRVAFINDDTFPMFVVSGLRGFGSLTEPVLFDGKWWIIGNPPGSAAAVALSSEDGRLWEASSQIAGDNGMSIRIDQLSSVDGALIAVGTEGGLVGPPFYSAVSGNLSLWRSADGERWVPEVVDQGSPSLAFAGIHLVQSGRTNVLQAEVHSIAPFNAANRMPPNVVAGLTGGRFELTTRGTLLVATGPLGIEVAQTLMAQVSLAPITRVFRSDSFADWSAVEIPFNVNGQIVAAPSGGFIASTGGVAFTSAYGVNWKPNPRAYEALDYEPWGSGHLIGYSALGDGTESIDLIDDEGVLSIQLPAEMIHCTFKGSNNLVAGACGADSFTSIHSVEWNGLELNVENLGLALADPSTSETRRFRIYRAPGTYDELTDTISLTDSRGAREAFPVDILRQLAPDSSIIRFDTVLSGDGLTWSRSQIALRATELELLGGIGDGFLVATRSSEPGSTLTVLAADF